MEVVEDEVGTWDEFAFAMQVDVCWLSLASISKASIWRGSIATVDA
jgi:hypothetical protein